MLIRALTHGKSRQDFFDSLLRVCEEREQEWEIVAATRSPTKTYQFILDCMKDSAGCYLASATGISSAISSLRKSQIRLLEERKQIRLQTTDYRLRLCREKGYAQDEMTKTICAHTYRPEMLIGASL